MNFCHRIRICFVISVFSYSFFSVLHASPAHALFSDPALTHNIWGSLPPEVKEDKNCIKSYITPFYQSAPENTGARDKFGSRVPTGDRLGRWNMLGIYFNIEDGAPADAPFNGANYPTLDAANTTLAGLTKDYTNEDLFDADDNETGHYSVPIGYEKVGIRLGTMLTTKSGFGFAIKGGFTEFNQAPKFIDKTPDTNPDADDINEATMDPSKRREIARELGYKKDLRCITVTAIEDTHAQIHWTRGYAMKDDDDIHVVTVFPYLAVGLWIPTGQSKDQDIAFSLPTGNDGFTGFTVEGALNFEFENLVQDEPNAPTLQFGGGVSATFFDTRDRDDYRVPTSLHQRGIFPWKTSIRQRLGTVWNIYGNLKTKFFLDNLSFFADYVYTRHESDSITIKEEDETRELFFVPEILEQDSAWRSQTIQAGFEYTITKNLSFGGAIQFQFNGRKVYRTTTLLGQVAFTF